LATLTYNAKVGNATNASARNVTVVADASGALTATDQVAILIDNTANYFDVTQALEAAIRRFHRDKSKNSKVSTIATSGTTIE